jgi:predicted Zn-dependent protease with MMP-like domain
MMQTSYIKIRFEWFVMSSINQSFEEFVNLIKNLVCQSLNNKKDIKNIDLFIKNSSLLKSLYKKVFILERIRSQIKYS